MNQTLTMPRELDHRESDGVSVTLLWYEDSDRVTIHVVDPRRQPAPHVDALCALVARGFGET